MFVIFNLDINYINNINISWINKEVCSFNQDLKYSMRHIFNALYIFNFLANDFPICKMQYTFMYGISFGASSICTSLSEMCILGSNFSQIIRHLSFAKYVFMFRKRRQFNLDAKNT